MIKAKISRILDVNINRATEGLRVLEEVARFIIMDKKLTEKARNIRYDLMKARLKIGLENHYVFDRDIEKDFGRKFKVGKREKLSDIIKANSKRAQEALRVLEEFSWEKGHFSKLRFKMYDIEKTVILKVDHVNASKSIDLSVYVVHDKVDVLKWAVKNGADIIQLRDKDSSIKKVIKKAKDIKYYLGKIKPEKRPIFIINDRVDIVWMVDADGVHLGQEDISIREARKILGIDKIIGKSTHNIKQGLTAQKNGATYISVGPVHATPTKPGRREVGLDYVNKAARSIKIPWVAIGGINKGNVDKVLRNGARNIAVVRAYKDIPILARKLKKLTSSRSMSRAKSRGL